MQSVCGAADRGRTGTIGEDRGILSPFSLTIIKPQNRPCYLRFFVFYSIFWNTFPHGSPIT